MRFTQHENRLKPTSGGAQQHFSNTSVDEWKNKKQNKEHKHTDTNDTDKDSERTQRLVIIGTGVHAIVAEYIFPLIVELGALGLSVV